MVMDANKLRKALASKLEVGDVLVLCERGIINSIHRLIQRTKKWHHVLLYVGNGKTLEVTPMKGCHISEFNVTSRRCKKFAVLRSKKLTQSQKKGLVKKAIRVFNGKKFSQLQPLKMLIFRHLFNFKISLNPSLLTRSYQCNAHNITCSTAVSIVYYFHRQLVSAVYKPEYVMPRDYDSPKDFYTVMEVDYDDGVAKQQPL